MMMKPSTSFFAAFQQLAYNFMLFFLFFHEKIEFISFNLSPFFYKFRILSFGKNKKNIKLSTAEFPIVF